MHACVSCLLLQPSWLCVNVDIPMWMLLEVESRLAIAAQLEVCYLQIDLGKMRPKMQSLLPPTRESTGHVNIHGTEAGAV